MTGDKLLMILGAITAILIAGRALLEALNAFIKWLPITANNIRELCSKEGWKRKEPPTE